MACPRRAADQCGAEPVTLAVALATRSAHRPAGSVASSAPPLGREQQVLPVHDR
jgi:hypothetical protein